MRTGPSSGRPSNERDELNRHPELACTSTVGRASGPERSADNVSFRSRAGMPRTQLSMSAVLPDCCHNCCAAEAFCLVPPAVNNCNRDPIQPELTRSPRQRGPAERAGSCDPAPSRSWCWWRAQTLELLT